jgi:hypothetical protein
MSYCLHSIVDKEEDLKKVMREIDCTTYSDVEDSDERQRPRKVPARYEDTEAGTSHSNEITKSVRIVGLSLINWYLHRVNALTHCDKVFIAKINC